MCYVTNRVYFFSCTRCLSIISIYYFALFPLQLLCLIGEAFDASSDEVCGAVVNIRPRGDKLAVWTGDVKKADAIKAIGLVFLFCNAT